MLLVLGNDGEQHQSEHLVLGKGESSLPKIRSRMGTLLWRYVKGVEVPGLTNPTLTFGCYNQVYLNTLSNFLTGFTILPKVSVGRQTMCTSCRRYPVPADCAKISLCKSKETLESFAVKVSRNVLT